MNYNESKVGLGLNPMQNQAVQTLDGPLLILAGAGSGKTRVLTQRATLLIATGKATPAEILAVTFTNKAAKEMESRIFRSLSDIGISVTEPLWVSTFHSFCTRILRRHITLLGYQSLFSIYDDGDQLGLIKKIMLALNINDKVTSVKTFKNRINSAKMMGLAPPDLVKSSTFYLDKITIELYSHYETEMKKANALDFGDLLMKAYDLFKKFPDVLEQYKTQFKYIMVDEYQDTNHLQYLLVKMLAQKHRNICVVGDEDQSIYSWRGADIRNILDFEKDFHEAKTIKLEENYRSTHNIVHAATVLIKNNSLRKDKTLFTNNPPGDLIQVREETSEYDEARFVARTIQSMINSGQARFSEFAVFYRTNAQSRVLEEQLRSHSLPYHLVGGVRFYERKEIKDILSYLKLSVNPVDDMAVRRIINVPPRGIGKTTTDRLEELASAHKLSLLQIINKCISDKEFNANTTSKLREFLTLINQLHLLSKEYSPLDFYRLVLDKTQYIEKLTLEDSTEAETRIQNLEEFSNAIEQFLRERENGSLVDFLEEMTLVSDIDSLDAKNSGVTLMTLHVSKGLEFPYVFIVGLEENLFPSHVSSKTDASTELEEERRLCYVGMTRAEKKLFLSYAQSRRVWGQEQFHNPSRFLGEIPKNTVNFSSGSYGSPSSSHFVRQFQVQQVPSASRLAQEHHPSASTSSSSEGREGNGKSKYRKGMRVLHPTFGSGSVFEVEGHGDQQKVSVLFADQTIKKFVAKYARLDCP